MRHLFPLSLTAILLWAAFAPAQQPPLPAKQLPAVVSRPAHNRHRGHVQPGNLADLIAKSHARHHDRLKALPRATATSFDARALGWVGPIKDQGQCGSCWDFSGTGVVESAYNKAGVGGGSSLFVLSEQYTLDCGSNGGCNGDDNTTVLAWAKATGLPLTSAYGPYQGGPSSCALKAGTTLYQVPDWGFADSNGGQGVTSVADIKAALQAYGPVGCAIAADNAFEAWGDDNPTFAAPFTGSGSRSIDHDVILVGWQDDTSKAGGYWILRNSWGTEWGVAGYMAISYGANLVGTEAVFALPPTSPTPAPPTPTPTGLTWTLAPGSPAGAAIDASGNFTWTIPATQQAGTTVTIVFAVTSGGQTATGSFVITVSAGATLAIQPIPNQTAAAGSTVTVPLGQYVTTGAGGRK